MNLNFVTVCTDAYPIEYAEKIHKRLKEVTKLDFNCYCLTDRPDKVNGWAVPLQPEVPTHGWWNKINLFSPSMPAGWNLYLDIDIVILRDFDEEVLWAIKNTNSIACVSDAIHWMGQRFSSSLMI